MATGSGQSGQFQGKIELDIRDSEPDWGPYAAPTAPESSPNILYLVWDDTGIATWDCFGGLVEMPAMTRIAERGVRLSQFHTTALCSPTRASLLTGRNATTVGMATIEEFTDGFPNCHGRIPADTALLSEALNESGYNTYCLGKWHLTETYHGPYRSRPGNPYAHGFDKVIASERRYIGGGDYFHPYFFLPGLPARSPGEYLTDRLAQEATGFIRRHRDRPFFLHVANYAVHTVLRAKPALLAKYRAKHGAGVDGARPVLAAMLESVDQQVGRIVRTLKDLGIAG